MERAVTDQISVSNYPPQKKNKQKKKRRKNDELLIHLHIDHTNWLLD